jgi:ADP-heptose:LPS heptosyltransferase
MNRPSEKTFIIDGGVGRVICSIPALKKYAKLNPDKNFNIIVWGHDYIFWSIKELQNKVRNIDQKNLFEDVVKNSIVVRPEPYALWSYYNQKKSLAQAFDEMINETDDHSDLENAKIILSKAEELNGFHVVRDVKEKQGKQKTIVIQPFGQSARNDRGYIVDDDTRSFEHPFYLNLAEKLAERYNLILFSPKDFYIENDKVTFKIETDFRQWAGIINACDYFVGCDSSGQHLARAFNKRGTVILGSTFSINTTYPDWFNIIEKKNSVKKYSPIRVLGLDCHLANRINDRNMDFDENETIEIFHKIVNDIEKER